MWIQDGCGSGADFPEVISRVRQWRAWMRPSPWYPFSGQNTSDPWKTGIVPALPVALGAANWRRSGRQAGAGFQAAGHRVSGVPHLPPVNPFPDQGWAVPSDSRLPFSVVAGPAFFGVARSHIDPAEGPSALLAVLGHR